MTRPTSDASSPEGAAIVSKMKYTVSACSRDVCSVCGVRLKPGSLVYKYGDWKGTDPHLWQCLKHVDDADQEPALSRPQAPTDQRIAELTQEQLTRLAEKATMAASSHAWGAYLDRGDFLSMWASLTVLQQRVDQLDNECRSNTHELMLIAKDTERGITDCSTPLFQRVRNIVEMLTAAEQRLEAAERERSLLESQLDDIAGDVTAADIAENGGEYHAADRQIHQALAAGCQSAALVAALKRKVVTREEHIRQLIEERDGAYVFVENAKSYQRDLFNSVQRLEAAKEAAEATIASLREAMNAHRLTCKTGGPNPDAIAALPSSSVARTAETEEP